MYIHVVVQRLLKYYRASHGNGKEVEDVENEWRRLVKTYNILLQPCNLLDDADAYLIFEDWIFVATQIVSSQNPIQICFLASDAMANDVDASSICTTSALIFAHVCRQVEDLFLSSVVVLPFFRFAIYLPLMKLSVDLPALVCKLFAVGFEQQETNIRPNSGLFAQIKFRNQFRKFNRAMFFSLVLLLFLSVSATHTEISHYT